MVQFEIDYISAGGNRDPAAADWDEGTGLLAYGSGRNIALWRPLVRPRVTDCTWRFAHERRTLNIEASRAYFVGTLTM